MQGRAKKGEVRNPNGRPAGVPNKFTADIRNMISTALSEVGGIEYLKQQAFENPVAFMGLIGKIIPAEVHAKIDKRIIKVEILVDGTGRAERADIIDQIASETGHGAIIARH